MFPYFVIFILCSPSHSLQRPQEIILYAESNYSGREISFYESISNLKSLGKVANAKSHCVVRGLWRVTGSIVSNGKLFVEIIYADEKNGKICGSWNVSNQTVEYESILSVGSQDLDTPAIQFHESPKFYGDPDLFFDGRILRLSRPIKYSSYGFTGKQNWTVFKGTDLKGHSSCLVANTDLDGNYGVTFNVNKTLVVGSIWRGCGSLDPKVLGRKTLENGDLRLCCRFSELQMQLLVAHIFVKLL